MIRALRLSVPALGLPCLVLFPAQEPADPLPTRDPQVTRAELEHHVRFLASDELGGRAALSAGAERTAQYLARALAEAGLEPAGEDGTYFQATGLRRHDYPAVPRLLLTAEDGTVVEAQHGVDFTVRVRGLAHSTPTLPLRFFYDYNHARMPKEGNPGEALYFSAERGAKKRILEEKGIPNLDDWGLEITVQKESPAGKARGILPPRLESQPEPEACELVDLRGPLVPDFERRKFTHIQLLLEETTWPHPDRNVVARIRGAGTAEKPELAQEVVLLCARYTAKASRGGSNARPREDSIFNGADDNASGCAALLELAQAIAAGPKPARTLVFLFPSGEENGHRGVTRYLEAPAEPLERTVAALDLERLGTPDELAGGPGKLWLAGWAYTSFGPAWSGLGLQGIVADPRPELGQYDFLDCSLFAQHDIVADTLSSFDGRRTSGTPGDEAGTLDYAHLEGASRLALAATSRLADGSVAASWVEKPSRKSPAARRQGEEEGLRKNHGMTRELRKNPKKGDERGDGQEDESEDDPSGGEDESEDGG